MICSGELSFGTGDLPGEQCLYANILTLFLASDFIVQHLTRATE